MLVAVLVLLSCSVDGLSAIPTTQAAANEISLANLPENVELKTLIDYVGQRLQLNLLYDDQLNNQKVTLKAPVAVSRDQLLGILVSALRLKGFAILDTDQPNLKRIVKLEAASAQAKPLAPGEPMDAQQRATAVLTQAFPLRYADPAKIESAVKSFLTQPGGSFEPVPDQKLVIVTDLASAMPRIEAVLKMIDQSKPDSSIEFVTAANADVTGLSGQVKQILAAKYGSQSGKAINFI